MGDNEKVEPVDNEVVSDDASVNSDDYIPEGCQKLYVFNDGPSKQYITTDDGSELLTFRANRKPAEKYYETLKSKGKCFVYSTSAAELDPDLRVVQRRVQTHNFEVRFSAM